MKYRFTVTYSIEGKKQTNVMEYDQQEILATLKRRLLTTFPNATSIDFTPEPSPR